MIGHPVRKWAFDSLNTFNLPEQAGRTHSPMVEFDP
jgi:hypothetical protein